MKTISIKQFSSFRRGKSSSDRRAGANANSYLNDEKSVDYELKRQICFARQPGGTGREKAKTIEPNLKAMRLANKLIKKPKHTNAALSFDCSNSAVHRFQKDASLSASLSSALTN